MSIQIQYQMARALRSIETAIDLLEGIEGLEYIVEHLESAACDVELELEELASVEATDA